MEYKEIRIFDIIWWRPHSFSDCMWSVSVSRNEHVIKFASWIFLWLKLQHGCGNNREEEILPNWTERAVSMILSYENEMHVSMYQPLLSRRHVLFSTILFVDRAFEKVIVILTRGGGWGPVQYRFLGMSRAKQKWSESFILSSSASTITLDKFMSIGYRSIPNSKIQNTFYLKANGCDLVCIVFFFPRYFGSVRYWSVSDRHKFLHC